MSAPSADAAPTNLDIALFLQREKRQLPERHHDFIDDMVNMLSRPSGPTHRQAEYLHALFNKLGGKIT
jgi:hypothetical protein